MRIMEPIPAVEEEEMMWTTEPIPEAEKKMLETMKMDELPEDKMFQLVHRGKWKEVVSLYEMYPDLRDKPLTGTNETTLHMAIMTKNKDVVAMLLDVLNKKNADIRIDVRDILTIENDEGVTPIHLAVTLDMGRECMDMVRLCPDLVTQVRNKDGETLLFKAVREGKKDLFFALELLLQKTRGTWPLEKMERDVTHCRRNDGNNILHIAIYGEYFELASEIVYLYPRLVNYVNERGELPLHYLANKPSSFKSGTSFNLFDQAIYSCIFIELAEKTKREFDKYKSEHESDKSIERPSDDQEGDKLREHASETCISQIFTFIKPIFGYASIISKWSETEQAKNDEENPGGVQQESFKEEKKRLPFPKIYEVGVFFFRLMSLLLNILGIVLRRIRTLKKMKQKHNHAYQLMNELVPHSQAWEYEKKDGMKLHIPSFEHSKAWEYDKKDGMDPGNVSRHSSGSLAPLKEPPPDDSSSCNDVDTSHNRVPQMPKKEKIIYREVDEPKEEETNKPDDLDHKETPVLVAAKNGITEIVKKILDTFPVAVWDMDKDEKNIMLLAVEYRQIHMYEFMNKRKIMNDSVFRKVDKKGNNALHLAAKLSLQKLPWDLGGAALRMQWDVKWYKYVMNSRGPQFFATRNSNNKTAKEIFSKEHKGLVKDAGEWMLETSKSFSVVATLIASVAFASATTVPGGTNQESGLPILSGVFPFKVFTIFALIAFCFSVASLLMFLNIITSPYRAEDFEKRLPGKFLLGFTSLFTAIAAMLVAFCAGNFLATEKELQSVAFAIYAITSFLVLIFALVQFPLYAYLLEATVFTLPPKSAQTMDIF